MNPRAQRGGAGQNFAMAVACFSTAVAVAGKPEIDVPADPLPDTTANRALFESGLRQYEATDREHGHFVEVNGIRMHYLEWGDARGVPLVWSHGYTSTGFELVQVGPGLADLGYHVFAITYRGHGQTQVANYDFSLAHIADDIAALLDQNGYRCAVIGGLSLGGGVTTTFYENYPQRAMGLVLEDGGADTVQNRIESAWPKVKPLFAAMPAPDWAYADRFAAYARTTTARCRPNLP
jgi:pimeloyl-ACP methyl ester carboxylesterase